MRKLHRKRKAKFPLQPVRKRQHLGVREIGVLRKNRRLLNSIQTTENNNEGNLS